MTALAIGFVCAVLLSWPLASWEPAMSVLASGSPLTSTYSTMWQVQAGIAAVALPILLFVIESARDERQAALRSAEVLIRESWTFLIIGISFAVVARMGVDLALWEDSQLVFATDFILFLLTIALALFAYQAVLRLIFSPSRLRERSIGLAKEKMRLVLLRSIKVRLGNNYMFAQLQPRVSYDVLPSRGSGESHYLTLRAARSGFFTDLHISGFLAFVAGLPWKQTPQVAPTGDSPRAGLGDDTSEPAVWFLRTYGDRIHSDHLDIVRLRRSAFRELNARELEARLDSLVRISDSDEL